MRSRLLARQGVAELLALPTLSARIEFLKQTDYGPALVAHLARERDPLVGADRGLRASLGRRLAQIDRFLEGERAQSLYRALVGFEDGWNVKTILRGVARGEAPERVFPLLSPTPALGDSALAELVGQPDVKAVVDVLATWGSPYAARLEEAIPVYLRHGELPLLEVALDRALFERALEAARGDGEDGRIVVRILERQIDLTNAATLLKLPRSGEAQGFFIAGGPFITAERFGRYARLEARELRESLARDGRRSWAPWVVRMAELTEAVAVDQYFARALRELTRREARLQPYSLAGPLAFVLESQAEVRRIRLILRGGEFGVPLDTLLPLVEA